MIALFLRAPRIAPVLPALGLVARGLGRTRSLRALGMLSAQAPTPAQSHGAGARSASPSQAAPPMPPHKPIDEEARAREARLLERCRAGDLEAFDELVAQHQGKIFNLCCWMLGDRDEAGDAAQDAFVRAWRAIGNFRADAAFGTWMHRIAVNVCLDARARRAKAPLTYSALEKPGDDGESRSFDPPDKADTPDKAVARRERRQVVLQALAALPEHHRAVVVLFDIQGYSYEDAAQALDLPMGTLKSRLNRARAALRKALEDQRELFED